LVVAFVRLRSQPAAATLIPLFAAALLAPSSAQAHGSVEERLAAKNGQIEAAPGEGLLLLDRAAIRSDAGDFRGAMADIDRAAALDPQLPQVDYLRGVLLWRQGRSLAAEASLSEFLAQEPESIEGYVFRARARADLGRSLDAARDFSEAIARQRLAGPDLYLERAQALVLAGAAHFGEALLGLEDGMAALGPLPALALVAVEVEALLGRTDAAVERLALATQRFPVQAPWWIRRGEIFESAGRVEEARDAYRRGLDEFRALPAQRQRVPGMEALAARASEGLARVEGR
jgi:tetratricopeptide (TPR) repeat protein